jgi:hypothetical protein
MEIAKVYRWFEKRSEEMSAITGIYYAGQSKRKPKIVPLYSSDSHVGMSQDQLNGLVKESERKLLEERNKFLRIFPKDKANYTREEDEENQRIEGYFEYLEDGTN